MKNYGSSISLVLGLFSFVIVFFLRIDPTTGIMVDYHTTSMLMPCLGSIAAIAGFFIGVFTAIQAKNESPLMRYGGVLLSTLGLANILFSFISFIEMLSWIN